MTVPDPEPTPSTPTADAGTVADSLVVRVSKLRAYTAKTAATYGLSASATQLEDDGRSSVCLVVGDSGAGKSALIASLLGRPGLLPVGVGHCRIQLGHGDPSAVASMPGYDGDPEVSVAVEVVATAAAADRSERPALIRATLPHPLLIGLDIIDCPGLDGLAGAHGADALSMLGAADAVLVVHDSNGPLRDGELQFLKAAADQVAAIAVVFAKADVAPEHHLLVDQAKAVLSRVPALRSAQVFAVSSTNYEQALAQQAHGGRLAVHLERLSGIAPLRQFLRTRVANQGQRLRLASVARECGAVLRRCADQVIHELGGQDEAELAAAESALGTMLAAEPSIRTDLNNVKQSLRATPRRELDGVIRSLREQVRADVESMPHRDLLTVPDMVQAKLVVATTVVWECQTGLAMEAADLLGNRLDGADEQARMRQALAGVDLEHDVAGAVSGGVGAPSAAYQQSLRANSRATMARLALMLVPSVMGAIGGVVAAPVTGGASLAATWMAVAGIAAASGGVGAVAWGQGKATQAQFRQHIRGWVDQALNDAQRGLGLALETRAQDISHHLDTRVLELITEAKGRRERLRAMGATMRTDPRRSKARERAETLRKESVAAAMLADQVYSGVTPPVRSAPVPPNRPEPR